MADSRHVSYGEDRWTGRLAGIQTETWEESEMESNLFFSKRCVALCSEPLFKTPGTSIGVTLVTAQKHPLSPSLDP